MLSALPAEALAALDTNLSTLLRALENRQDSATEFDG
jgi:hypothetical protein